MLACITTIYHHCIYSLVLQMNAGFPFPLIVYIFPHRMHRHAYIRVIYIICVEFILDLTPCFNKVGNDSCKAKRETLMFCDLVGLIPEDLWLKFPFLICHYYKIKLLTYSCFQTMSHRVVNMLPLNKIRPGQRWMMTFLNVFYDRKY